MKKGETYQERTKDQFDASTPEFIEKSIDEMRALLGEDVQLALTVHPLTSEFSPTVIGNNLLTILWHNSSPAAISLETRDDFNFTVTQQVFFGPNNQVQK